jgi:hypothetical protein
MQDVFFIQHLVFNSGELLILNTAGNYLLRGGEGVWYADGVRAPVVTPNMRTVSNNLFRADESKYPLSPTLLFICLLLKSPLT